MHTVSAIWFYQPKKDNGIKYKDNVRRANMIQVNKEYLKNEGYTSTIIEKAKRELSRKRARYNRYTRSQYKSTIDIAMEYYIVNIASGYFGGIAPLGEIPNQTK